MEQTKYKMIENFAQKFLGDKKYLKHSDIDLFVNLRLTGILNYINLLSEEDSLYIAENHNRNYKYITEIDSGKIQMIEEGVKNNSNSQNTNNNLFNQPRSKRKFTNLINNNSDSVGNNFNNSSENSLLFYSMPQFEIYFTVRLIVNGLVIEPEALTDLVQNPDFNEFILLRYKYKDLTPDACLAISIHSMQLPQEKSLIASTTVNLFDENFNLQQGQHVFKLYPKVEADLRAPPKCKTPGKVSEQNYKEVDQLINTFYNGIISQNSNRGVNSNLNLNLNLISSNNLNDNYYLNFESKLNSLLTRNDNSYLEILFPIFNYPIIFEEEKYPVYKQYYKSLNIKTNNNMMLKLDNFVCDTEIRKGKNFLSKDNPITEKFSTLSRISDDAFARDIRPTHFEESRIKELLNTPDFIKLEDNDVILFWKYRYHFLNKKFHLTKILNAVKWGDPKSENEFMVNIFQNGLK